MAENLNENGRNKWSVFAVIVSLFVVIEVVLWALSGLITFPTAAHRNSSEQIATASVQALSDGRSVEFFTSDEYTALTSTPEARYSSIADLVTAGIHFVIWVFMVGAIYIYLRKQRIAEKPVRATVLCVGAGALLVAILTGLLSHLFYPSTELAGGFDNAAYVLGLPISVGLSMLFAAIVAWILQARYKRKSGFSE